VTLLMLFYKGFDNLWQCVSSSFSKLSLGCGYYPFDYEQVPAKGLTKQLPVFVGTITADSVRIRASTVLWKAKWDEFIEQSIRRTASSHKFTFCDNP
ncbi:hypothetical protein Tco_1464081, partial [Tanacetum coccineum]